MHQLIRTIHRFLEKDKPIALVTIIEQSGSAPRSSGAAMLVTSQGHRQGSIGGGRLEAAAQQAAVESLSRQQPRLMSFDLSNQEASESGMVCGGRVELLIDVITPLEDERELFSFLDRSLEQNQPCTLVRTIFGREGTIDRVERCLINQWGLTCGSFSLSQSMFDDLLALGLSAREPTLFSLDRARLLIEPVYGAETVYLFGAGHISQAVAGLAHRLGLRVVVLDDREDFANRQRFPKADDIRLLDDFQKALTGLHLDQRSFALILTRGHQYDKTVLGQVLTSRVGYIGMIGSRRKREAVFEALRSEGYAEADLKRVHCPVGLDIGAETPEEIAVSITAELIAVRRKRPA